MGRSIMIVGNGPVAEGTAAIVDAADFVVRFNFSRNYERAGTRTDAIVVCNTGRPAHAMLGSAEWRESASVLATAEIWSVRDPAKFAALKPVLAVSHPHLDDFCDDRTEDFAAFALSSGKLHSIIPASVHEDVDAVLAGHGEEPYVVPSSGLIAMFHILCHARFVQSEIVLAGFSHEGWDGHPFAAERRLVDSLVAEGRLRRLSPAPSSSTSQGA